MGMHSKKHDIAWNGSTDFDLSNELNVFYNRFNVHDFSEEVSGFKDVDVDLNTVHSSVSINEAMVLKLFRGVKERKRPGPDGIGGRLLKKLCYAAGKYFLLHFSAVFTAA